MGYVDVRAILANPKGTPQREVEFLVDTGCLSFSYSERLGG